MERLEIADLEPQAFGFDYRGKAYVLREVNAGGAARYRNAMLKATKLGPDGKVVGFDGLASTELYLVALCLFEQVDGKERPVSQAEVETWQPHVVAKLYAEAKRISRLDESDDSKNGRSATTDVSA